MRQSKGIAVTTTLLGILVFTVLVFSYSDFVALVRAQYGDYDKTPPPVTKEQVEELFADVIAADPAFEVTDEQLQTLPQLVLVRALISGSTSEEISNAIRTIIVACPDIVGLAYTGSDGESDDIQVSIDTIPGTGIGLAESGEGVILVTSEIEAVFPVEDVAANLIRVFESLARERFGDEVDFEALNDNQIAGILVAMDPLVFAIEPNFLLEAQLLEYDPLTGYAVMEAIVLEENENEDDEIIGEALLKLVPVGEEEDEADQEYIVGIAPLPEN